MSWSMTKTTFVVEDGLHSLSLSPFFLSPPENQTWQLPRLPQW